METAAKRYTVTIEVELPEGDVVRLRRLLPDLLQGAGFAPATGTTTVESWLVEATSELAAQPSSNGGRGQSERVPVSRRGRGAGPNG